MWQKDCDCYTCNVLCWQICEINGATVINRANHLYAWSVLTSSSYVTHLQKATHQLCIVQTCRYNNKKINFSSPLDESGSIDSPLFRWRASRRFLFFSFFCSMDIVAYLSLSLCLLRSLASTIGLSEFDPFWSPTIQLFVLVNTYLLSFNH